MADRSLSLLQQLALLPDHVPDCIVDFLEDFVNTESSLTKPETLALLDPSLAATAASSLKPELDAQRAGMGKVTQLQINPVNGAPRKFTAKINFSAVSRGNHPWLHSAAVRPVLVG
jgi:hypothetical protein